MKIRQNSLGGSILLGLLAYNYIFPLRFTFFPNFSDLVYFFSLVIFLSFLVYKRAERLLFNKLTFSGFLSWSVLFALAVSSIIINMSNDLGVIRVLINYFFTWLYALCLLGCVRLGMFGGEFKFDRILKITVISCFVVSVSVLLEVVSPSFKNQIMNVFFKSGNINYLESFRASGFSAAGGAALSFGLALGCGISLIMALHADNAFRRLFFCFISFSVFSAIIFIGRTGLIFSAFFIIMSLRYFCVKSPLSFGIMVSIVCVLLGQLFFVLPEDMLSFYMNYSLEPFNNYFEYGSFESTSSNAVADMYFLPNVKHIIFGAGFMNEALHGYTSPDPGYMKVLLSFGVVGFILFYSLSIFIVCRVYRHFSKFDARYKFLFFIVLMSFFVYEAKEPGFYQNYGFRILMLLFTFEVVATTNFSSQKNNPGTI